MVLLVVKLAFTYALVSILIIKFQGERNADIEYNRLQIGFKVHCE